MEVWRRLVLSYRPLPLAPKADRPPVLDFLPQQIRGQRFQDHSQNGDYKISRSFASSFITASIFSSAYSHLL